jgi:hypothetical protein
LGSILDGPKFSSIKKDIESTTDDFYNYVIKSAIKDGIIKDVSPSSIKGKEWKKHISSINNKYVNSKLKGKESLFKTISDLIEKVNEDIANSLVHLILKLDLKQLLKNDFKFSLITGIGRYLSSKGIVIEKADVKDLDTIVEKMDALFTKEKHIHMRFNPKKTPAFEKGATAAKLFYVLYVGNFPLFHLEIRYKGSFTSQPQILGTLTPEFKSFLHTGE